LVNLEISLNPMWKFAEFLEIFLSPMWKYAEFVE